MPLLYSIVLYMTYESFFVRVNILLRKDKEMVRFVKWKVVALCHVNLRKLNRFIKECTSKLMKVSDRDDILNIIENFRATDRIGP